MVAHVRQLETVCSVPVLPALLASDVKRLYQVGVNRGEEAEGIQC